MNMWISTAACLLISGGLAACQIQHVPTIVTPNNSICPSDAELDAIRSEINGNISELLMEVVAEKTNSYTIPECGGSGWRQVALLDMSDPNQACPDQWRLYNMSTSDTRACGRSDSRSGSCDSVSFSTNGYSYTEVCGRITGYQYASPDGMYLSRHLRDIDSPYVDGVSVTCGSQRQHIWTFYAGVREFAFGCCSTYSPADFVGTDYFCDTGNPDNVVWRNTLFTDYPLWDGMAGCPSNSTCCAPHSGPWFHSQLTVAPVEDDIEVRICGGEPTSNEDTPLELIEMYVRN